MGDDPSVVISQWSPWQMGRISAAFDGFVFLNSLSSKSAC
ncbi:unnamed protein product [Mycetohabitans rhizoxinica HKI 454]|uniref:Uncharacterized protein n=1 Tax=Mycetohabitans rhizoxinica (strain DSM 19002 / CIP 109453 / HKI 454) TaxID=882378 RepID=E5AQ32_MYCRK|nr:unnamed protein product [Mycetohabitans rhizoxinica HKI 454]